MNKGTKDFLEYLHNIVKYWVGIAEQNKLDYKDFAESLIFSILVEIDGCGMGNPILLCSTNDSGNVVECINDEGDLHDNWYK